MTAVTRRRVQTTQITSTWSGTNPVTADCFANQGLSQHMVSVWCSGVPTTGVVNISVRPKGASFFVPVGTIDLTVNGTGTMMFCAILDGIQLSFPGGVSAGITIGATIYSVGLYFTVGDDYLQDDARRRVVSTMITQPGPWNGSGTVTMPMTDHAGLAQHQLAITGGTGLVELQGRPQGGTAFVSIDVQCQQITASGMLVIFAGLWDAFRLVPQGTVTGSIQAQIASVGELLFFNNVAQGTYGSATTVPVITVNGGGQIVDITSVPINVSGALGYTPLGTFNGRSGTGSPPNVNLLASDVSAVLTGSMIDTALGYTPPNPSTFAFSLRNKLINPNFDFWQRTQNGATLASVASVSAKQYVADRWVHQVNGTSCAVTQQLFATGQSAVPNNPTYYLQCVVTSVAGAGNFCIFSQILEGVRTLAGQVVTLSFWAKAATAMNIAVEMYQSFGAGGSPSSPVSTPVGLVAITTAWQQYKLTFTLPSISGQTIGTNVPNVDALQMVFWMDAGSSFSTRASGLGQQSGTFDFAQVQLEQNNVASSFEIRPLGLELMLCQRFYEKSFDTTALPANNTGTSLESIATIYGATGIGGAAIQFKVRKRVAPTVTFFSSNNTASPPAGVWQFNSTSSGWTNGSSMSLIVTTDWLLPVINYATGGLTVGQSVLIGGGYAADAEV